MLNGKNVFGTDARPWQSLFRRDLRKTGVRDTGAGRTPFETLVRLQQEYRDWYDMVPETLHDSATGELLDIICTLDLSELEAVTPPRRLWSGLKSWA